MDLTQEAWSSKQAKTEGSIIIDVRTPEEFKNGHMANSQLLDIQEPQTFFHNLKLFDKSRSYFIYCRTGARSATACQIFKQQGILNCFNLLGGILDWKGGIEK